MRADPYDDQDLSLWDRETAALEDRVGLLTGEPLMNLVAIGGREIIDCHLPGP